MSDAGCYMTSVICSYCLFAQTTWALWWLHAPSQVDKGTGQSNTLIEQSPITSNGMSVPFLHIKNGTYVRIIYLQEEMVNTCICTICLDFCLHFFV